MIIDNRTVQKRVDAAMQRRLVVPRFGFRGWMEVEHLAAQLPVGCRCYWIPSHGKKKGEWQPPSGHTEQGLRTLNSEADKAADVPASKRWKDTSYAEDAVADSGQMYCLHRFG